jgi:L-lysine exporter family protein LysE/ArgO
MLFTLFKGFSSSASLIIAIGAQNAFVIRQGLLRRYLFLTALICSLLDAVLISLGILGFGHLISSYPLTVEIAKYFAVLFLLAYGAISLKSAFKSNSLRHAEDNDKTSLKKTIFILLALALLNPHAYLDTVILLGTIASQQPVYEQLYFAIGAVSASFVWFFCLTYGSRLLAPLLCKPISWKIIDTLTAFTMWGIATMLLLS